MIKRFDGIEPGTQIIVLLFLISGPSVVPTLIPSRLNPRARDNFFPSLYPQLPTKLIKVSWFVSSHTTVHWATILCILRYIRSTLYQSLLLPSSFGLELRAFSNGDWAGDPSDSNFTTGFYTFLNDSLISWRSKKKQSVVVRSSVEAEYRAMTSTTAEIVWLY